MCVGGAKNDPKNLGNNEQNPDGMCKHIGVIVQEVCKVWKNGRFECLMRLEISLLLKKNEKIMREYLNAKL